MIKSSTITRAGYVMRIRDMRNAYKILVGKPERKRPLGRLRSKLEYNIKVDHREIRMEVVDWTHLA
jgi:hypothetical protein